MRWGWVAVAALAAACTAAPPTVTSNPLSSPAAGGTVVSVCYDSSDHSRAEVEKIALQACPTPTAAVTPWRRDKLLNDCPLLKKSRISFLCVPARRATLPLANRRANVTMSQIPQ